MAGEMVSPGLGMYLHYPFSCSGWLPLAADSRGAVPGTSGCICVTAGAVTQGNGVKNDGLTTQDIPIGAVILQKSPNESSCLNLENIQLLRQALQLKNSVKREYFEVSRLVSDLHLSDPSQIRSVDLEVIFPNSSGLKIQIYVQLHLNEQSCSHWLLRGLDEEPRVEASPHSCWLCVSAHILPRKK